MTGFGRFEGDYDGNKFQVEIYSVNSRYLNIDLNLSQNLLFLQEPINKLLKQHISRGNVKYRITFSKSENSIINTKINKDLIKNYINELRTVKREFNLKNNDVSISDLLLIPDIFSTDSKDLENSEFTKSILSCTEKALDNLIEMELQEGEFIKKSFLKIIENIREENVIIKKLQRENIVQHLEKLKERVKKLLDIKTIDDDSIQKEIVLLADKLDISEENERLESHIEQFKKYLDYDENIGKRLTFLIQESFREIATTGNKVNSSEISQKVVEIKNQLEILREQCQNIQ
ncbi:MAG: YicC/YloC family endoribonuclease [Candidatus Marinimicrobia bacterium]|nr:YicC/YloC family endoribonuclease [Candidatus Neomarinimicrobiota bacterium]